jgi:hypothetical protein
MSAVEEAAADEANQATSGENARRSARNSRAGRTQGQVQLEGPAALERERVLEPHHGVALEERVVGPVRAGRGLPEEQPDGQRGHEDDERARPARAGAATRGGSVTGRGRAGPALGATPGHPRIM